MKELHLPALTLALLAGVATPAASDDKVAIKDVPAEALKALLIQSGGAKLVEISKEKEGGKTIYEAEWDADGKIHEAEVDASGNVLEVEKAVSESGLPPAVAATVKAQIEKHGGNVIEVEAVTSIFYEVEIKDDGKVTELVISSQGKVIRRDKEEEDD